MREAQAKNRERAIQAITQKNNLQALADQMEKRVSQFTKRARIAESPEDRQDFLAERDKVRQTLGQCKDR